MSPSSRFALSLKPRVAYLALNFCALWKKQMILPSMLAYAGMPYQVFGERDGALALMISCSRAARRRSGSCIAAIAASAAFSPSALFLLMRAFCLQLFGALLHCGFFLVREALGRTVDRRAAPGRFLRFRICTHKNLLTVN